MKKPELFERKKRFGIIGSPHGNVRHRNKFGQLCFMSSRWKCLPLCQAYLLSKVPFFKSSLQGILADQAGPNPLKFISHRISEIHDWMK